MPNYASPMNQADMNSAADWYVNSLKSQLTQGMSPEYLNQLGIAPVDQSTLANPDGSTDNYRGYKAAVDKTKRDVSRARNYSDSVTEDYGTTPEMKQLFYTNPAEWERRVRDNIKGWTIGHEDNQQYMYDAKTGALAKQWTNDTSAGDTALLGFAAIAGGAALGFGSGLLAADGAGAGVGSATLSGGQTLTPALMESGMGTAGYGASSTSGLINGAMTAGGAGATAAEGALDASAGGTGTWQTGTIEGGPGTEATQSVAQTGAQSAAPTDASQVYNQADTLSNLPSTPASPATPTTPANIESSINTPGYGTSSAGGGANATASFPGVNATVGDWTDWATRFGSNLVKKIQEDPWKAIEWISGGVGLAWMADKKAETDAAVIDKKIQGEKDLENTKNQNAIDKEKRVAAGVAALPKRGVIKGAMTRRADGQAMFQSNGQLNRS